MYNEHIFFISFFLWCIKFTIMTYNILTISATIIIYANRPMSASQRSFLYSPLTVHNSTKHCRILQSIHYTSKTVMHQFIHRKKLMAKYTSASEFTHHYISLHQITLITERKTSTEKPL